MNGMMPTMTMMSVMTMMTMMMMMTMPMRAAAPPRRRGATAHGGVVRFGEGGGPSAGPERAWTWRRRGGLVSARKGKTCAADLAKGGGSWTPSDSPREARPSPRPPLTEARGAPAPGKTWGAPSRHLGTPACRRGRGGRRAREEGEGEPGG